MEEALKKLYDIAKSNGHRLSYNNPLTNKYFVLDLDQTFIATQDDKSYKDYRAAMASVALRRRLYHLETRYTKHRGDGDRYKFWGVTRPETELMLKFLMYYGRVGVWTAATAGYAKDVVQFLFKDFPEPKFVNTRKDLPSESKPIKPLKKLFQEFPEMNYKNTMALDDNIDTFAHNINNGILIPAYEVSTLKEYLADDQNFALLANWLLKPHVINSTDVSKLDKTHIFD
jgi:hypothetical protein